MISTAKAQNELNTLKDHVIGLFKKGERYSLVMNYQETNKTADLMYLTEFGIIRKEFNVPSDFGKLILFPDNKNMNQMTEDVFAWNEFMKQF